MAWLATCSVVLKVPPPPDQTVTDNDCADSFLSTFLLRCTYALLQGHKILLILSYLFSYCFCYSLVTHNISLFWRSSFHIFLWNYKFVLNPWDGISCLNEISAKKSKALHSYPSISSTIMSLYTCVKASNANFPKNNDASVIVLSRLCSKTNFKLEKNMKVG